MAQPPPEEALTRVLKDLGSQRVEDVHSGTGAVARCAPPRLPSCHAHKRTDTCTLPRCLCLPFLSPPAASALRKHVRASPEEAAAQLVRLTPSWSELLRAWDTLHDGHRAQDAAVPLLGALADVLWVHPGTTMQAHTVLHASLDGLARTVRFCVCMCL